VDDKFRIERKLGEGGTSTIYEVRHVVTDKLFVIKWLSPELAQNELAVQRFIHEARVCGRFKHPNAVEIYDIARTEDSYYLLMELLEGESLETRLARLGRLSAQAACDILLPCTEALGAAHQAGIVHRDLKPSNIFLCRIEGRAGELPKVLDFGISKLSPEGHDLSPVTTTTRTVIGTPLYMAPEQMRGHPAEPRFDIYALGVVLYELVAGQPPFECDTFADLVFKIIEAQPTRLDQLANVDAGFAEIVARAMARDVDARYATMAEFAEALRPYSSQGVPRAVEAPQLAPPLLAAPLLAAPPRAVEAPQLTPPPVTPPTSASSPEVAPPRAVIDLPFPYASTRDAAPPLAAIEDELPSPLRRKTSVRWIGVAAGLGVALIVVWHTSAREPHVVTSEALRPESNPVAPLRQPDSPVVPPLTAEAWTGRTSEPVVHAEPRLTNPAELAAKTADTDNAKPGRRAAKPHAAKLHPPAKPNAKRAVAAGDSAVRRERGSPDDDIAVPEADLSRQDF
jgi:serine/threonine-protein kinase